MAVETIGSGMVGIGAALAPQRPSTAVQRMTGGFIDALTPRNFQDAFMICEILAKSNAVPKHYAGRPNEILIAAMHGASLGLTVAQSVQAIAVINGRPSVWGDFALGIVRAHPDFVEFEEFFEGDVTAWKAVVAVCIVTRKGQKPIRREFSLADAAVAKLLSKDGPWQTYPKRMLQMRARSWALRDSFADALAGLYIAEEAMDIPEDRLPEPILPAGATRTDEALAHLRTIEQQVEPAPEPTKSTEEAPAEKAEATQDETAPTTASPNVGGALPEDDELIWYATDLGLIDADGNREGLRKFVIAKTGKSRLTKTTYPVVLAALKETYEARKTQLSQNEQTQEEREQRRGESDEPSLFGGE